MNNKTKSNSILYKDTSECCGCGGCSLVCPKKAISMRPDKYGVIYPDIDLEKCVGCNICVNSCSFGKNKHEKVLTSYAASNIDEKQRNQSSSGGIFPAIALDFLKKGDIVVGVSLAMADGKASIRHIMIEKERELPALQGSKYVQSDGLVCYNEIKQALSVGRKVLYSGTPCQVAEFRSLFKKYDRQIYTIDIICHGVPGLAFFNDYLMNLQTENRYKIYEVTFRDKRYGWGKTGIIKFEQGGTSNKCLFSAKNSSYYRFFDAGEISRDSCYSCPYACLQRPGDLTLGDYWGAQRFSPELMQENGGVFNSKEGISCVLCNSPKGREMLDIVQGSLILKEVDIDKILIINKQLREPAKHTPLRDKIFSAYEKDGYAGIEKIFKKLCRSENRKKLLKSMIPKPIFNALKKILK